jgi:predicted flap endonuclease-1-like 5' DNA nuclease
MGREDQKGITGMTNVIDIEGIGPVNAEKLKAAGIDTVEELLSKGASPAGRQALATSTGISEATVLEWVNRADLFRVRGVGEEYSDLLESSGVDTVVELSRRNAENLLARMKEVNAAKKLVRREPRLDEVEAWIREAKTMPRVVTY